MSPPLCRGSMKGKNDSPELERDGATQVLLLLQVHLCCREEGMKFERSLLTDAGPTFPVHCTSCSPGTAVLGTQAALEVLGKESPQIEIGWILPCPNHGDSLPTVTSSPKPPRSSTRRFPSNTNAFCCIRLMDNTACSSFYLCNYSFPLRASLPLPSLPPPMLFHSKAVCLKINVI